MPVFSTAYCPPVAYIAKIAEGMSFIQEGGISPANIVIESYENYQKQSWRNRCRILSSQGPADLSFPVIHRNGSHNGIGIREVEIDYSTDWVHRHKVAIASAYGTSAFFEYYADDFFSILDSRPSLLLELNMTLLHFFLDKVGVVASITFSDAYSKWPDGEDFRELIHPKRECPVLDDLNLKKPYFQVFSGKYGFIPNLSIMDLLFNEGPDSILYLKNLK